MDTKTKSIDLAKLAEMNFRDVAALWRQQRRELFIRLSKEGMRYEDIASKYGVTRQYVGHVIKKG
jgi:transposase